jgi:hypothetical protein
LPSGVCSFRQRWIRNRAHFTLLMTEITLATARNASREDRHKVKRNRVGKYAAIGAPILSLICFVYILMQGYAK